MVPELAHECHSTEQCTTTRMRLMSMCVQSLHVRALYAAEFGQSIVCSTMMHAAKASTQR